MGGTGAGEGNRTLVVSLGSFCSTIELHPPGAARLAQAGAAVNMASARGFADRFHRDEGRGAGDVRQAGDFFAEHDAIAADVGGADLEQIVEAARDHVALLDLGDGAHRGVELL